MQRLNSHRGAYVRSTISAATEVNEHDLTASRLGSLEYAPAPESSAIATSIELRLFIDGAFTDPSSHEQFVSLNPANEEVLATVAQSSREDIDRAVRSARRAYEEVWSHTSGAERAKYLYRIAA